MGIPYSRQINAAFDQVTPLVAEGFKVLETTKNISILLAAIQVLTVILLLLILFVLLALLITVNPDLDSERRALVTPVVTWFTSWITESGHRRYLGIILFVMAVGAVVGASGGIYLAKNRSDVEEAARKEVEGEGDESLSGDGNTAKA